MKYGKLVSGQQVCVPQALIKRCKQHFLEFVFLSTLITYFEFLYFGTFRRKFFPSLLGHFFDILTSRDTGVGFPMTQTGKQSLCIPFSSSICSHPPFVPHAHEIEAPRNQTSTNDRNNRLPSGVSMILGNNGYVWLSRALTEDEKKEKEARDKEEDPTKLGVCGCGCGCVYVCVILSLTR
jgi:hypothetical protein